MSVCVCGSTCERFARVTVHITNVSMHATICSGSLSNILTVSAASGREVIHRHFLLAVTARVNSSVGVSMIVSIGAGTHAPASKILARVIFVQYINHECVGAHACRWMRSGGSVGPPCLGRDLLKHWLGGASTLAVRALAPTTPHPPAPILFKI